MRKTTIEVKARNEGPEEQQMRSPDYLLNRVMEWLEALIRAIWRK
jgi:hypothetical protein